MIKMHQTMRVAASLEIAINLNLTKAKTRKMVSPETILPKIMVLLEKKTGLTIPITLVKKVVQIKTIQAISSPVMPVTNQMPATIASPIQNRTITRTIRAAVFRQRKAVEKSDIIQIPKKAIMHLNKSIPKIMSWLTRILNISVLKQQKFRIPSIKKSQRKILLPLKISISKPRH